MATNKPVFFRKDVAELPTALQPDTLYFVRAGAGFDLYLSDVTGGIAHGLNKSSGTATIPELTQDPANATAGAAWLLEKETLGATPIAVVMAGFNNLTMVDQPAVTTAVLSVRKANGQTARFASIE